MATPKDLAEVIKQDSYIAVKQLLQCANDQKTGTHEEWTQAKEFLDIVKKCIVEVGANWNALLQAKGILEKKVFTPAEKLNPLDEL